MTQAAQLTIIRQIESIFDGDSVAGLPDRQLLERFINRRDRAGDAAFAALVSRHGPMVLLVCRQLLGDLHLAEDAFQAVFLILARRALSIRDPDLLATWLHQVSIRTARKAKVRHVRRQVRELVDTPLNTGSPLSSPTEQAACREHCQVLHEEIDRLSSPFRSVVMLCYLERLTVEQAAARLRCPPGTVRSRMARARAKLRRALTRRGITAPAAALAAAFAARPAAASVSSRLCETTAHAALLFADRSTAAGCARVSASASALAHLVLRSMIVGRMRFIASTVLALSTVAASARYLAGAIAAHEERPSTLTAQSPPASAEPRACPTNAASGPMTVTGSILNPAGKAMPDVPVDFVGRPRVPYVAAVEKFDAYDLLGQGATGDDGQFHVDITRTSSARFFDVYALAKAPGYGLCWTALDPDDRNPSVQIRLRPEQPLRVRLVDLNGQPAANVEVHVASIRHRYKIGPIDGVYYWSVPPAGLRVWPAPLRTNDHGSFALAGLAVGDEVLFDARDQRYARMGLHLQADDREGPRDVTLSLRPATIIEGQVLAADSGQPIPYATIRVSAGEGRLGGMFATRFRADAQGRFEVNPSVGDYFHVTAYPTGGEPYLSSPVEFAWTKGAVRKHLDIPLPRGALIRGTVTELGSSTPLSNATVQFLSMNPRARNQGGSNSIVASKDDGSFQIVVPPEKGHLLVFGPSPDFILELIGERTLRDGRPGGRRTYAHKIVAYEAQAGAATQRINAALRRGNTVRGRLIGPQGQAVKEARILSRLHIEHYRPQWRGDFVRRQAIDGVFEINGPDPEKPVPVYFLDAINQWGAAIELSGKQSGEETTIHLQPCGTAMARFVGPDGKPLASVDLRQLSIFEILVTPGPHWMTFDKNGRSQLAADADSVSAIDRDHYADRYVTDAAGRITFPVLIPGAMYRVSDYSTRNVDQKGVQIRKDFTVKPGEKVDLGDILIEKPSRS